MIRTRAACLLLCVGVGCAGQKTSRQDTLFGLVPDRAVGAVLLRADALKPFRRPLTDDPGLETELRQYLETRIGLDLTAVTSAVVFVMSVTPPEGAIVLHVDAAPGTAKWPHSGEESGVPMYRPDDKVYAAVLPRAIVLGTEAGVRGAIATLTGRAKALSSTSPLAELLQVEPTSQLAFAVSADAVPAALKPMIAMYGLKTVVLGYSPSRVFAWATGEQSGLILARDTLQRLLTVALDASKTERDKAVSGDNTLLGAIALVSYAQTHKLAAQVSPRIMDGKLLAEYRVPPNQDSSTAVLAAGVGIGAAIAIPAFIKYIRRSKTVEATMNVRQLYDSAVAYVGEHKGALPMSTDWTPACCPQEGHSCAANPADFAGPTWKALSFSLLDKHYYQYRFVSAAKSFTVEARGDLDCDGIFSSFSRTGTVDAEGTVTGKGLETKNEIE